MSYEIIKSYYDMGLFTKEDLQLFVDCGWITQEQMNEIISGK